MPERSAQRLFFVPRKLFYWLNSRVKTAGFPVSQQFLVLFMLSKEAVAKFKRIYLAEFGTELSDPEANEMATSFLNVMREIIEPVPQRKVANV